MRKPIEAPEKIYTYSEKTLSGMYFIERLYKSDIEYIRADKYTELEKALDNLVTEEFPCDSGDGIPSHWVNAYEVLNQLKGESE